jgi:hypothetical protein
MQRIGGGMNITCIDFDRLEVYEAGALLVTLLAYPEEGEETRGEVCGGSGFLDSGIS